MENIKKRWVEALRSGNYKQTTGCLRNGDGFCCLGVLCDIVDPEGWGNGSSLGIPYRHGNFIPDAKTLQLVGIESGASTEIRHLTEMNDNSGNTFSDIADWIEENL
jgi:hypothetical protein